MDAETLRFTKPSNVMPTENAEALRNRTLRCNLVYDEYVFNGTITGGLQECIQHSTH